MKVQSFLAGATPSPARARSSLGAASFRSSIVSNEGSAGASKNLVPLPREQQRSDPFMGATIGKFFGSQYFHGQVIAIDVDVASGERAYHIAYEDGDEEHLSVHEVKKCFIRHGGRSAPASEAGGLLSAAGSRRPSTTLAYSSAPTPRPSTSGATASRHPTAAASWPGSDFTFGGPGLVSPTSQIGASWAPLAIAALAVLVAVGVLPSCLSCLMGETGMEGEDLLASGAARSAVGGLAQPLPPWAQEASLAAAGAVPAHTAFPVWSQPELAAAAALQDERLHLPREEPQQKEMEDVSAPGPSVPSWAVDVPPPDAFAQLPPEPQEAEQEQRPSTPAPPLWKEGDAEFASGQAPAMADSVAEEEMSAAAAALAEASGLVIRVAARSFFRALEEVWQSILSGFSSATAVASSGSSVPDVPPLAEVTHDDEEASIGSACHEIITFLLASLGVLTILWSVLPCRASPFPAVFAGRQSGAAGFGIPAQPAGAPEAVRQGHGVPPSPQRLAAAPSPPPLQHSPVALVAAPSPQVAPRRLAAAPAPITPSASLAAAQCEGTGARTLMALMGRTPAPAMTAPAATNPAGAAARAPPAPPRRPPPPPASLVQAPVPQIQTPQPQLQTPQIQVNAWYVESAPQCQERVVKVVALRQDSAFVQPYALNRLRSGKITFSRDKRFAGEVLVKAADLKDGPFHMAPGGRAPAYINARFGGAEELEQHVPPVPNFHVQAKCSGCGQTFASDAAFCRHCGQRRGVEAQGPTTPVPLATPGTGGRLKSKLVIDESRFRYTSALSKLKEMGFEDCPELRDVLTKWGGDVSYTLREINRSPVRGGVRA